MDGSYNQPFGHGQAHGPSHLNSPQTPSSATYQTNVNRSKTRKWVEARQQTYDGDDWGTDDFDQEPDSPPHHQQQQPPVPASSRLASYGQRTPSGSVPPPAQPSALHIPPQQQAEPPAQVAYMPANAALSHGPGPSSMASPSQLGAQDQVVSPQHLGAIQSPAAEPQSQHASAPVHGSWQDSAMTDAGHLDHLGHIGRKNTTRKPVGGAMPVSEGPANNSTDAPAEPAKSRVQVPSADIGPEHGVENVAESSVVAPKGEVVTAQSAEQGAGEGCQLHEGDKIDRQRLSTSPQLPDVARMSAFGADLFAADQKRASTLGQAPREESEAEQAQATLVGQNDVPVDVPHPATNDSEHAVASSTEAPKRVATSDNLPISSGIDLAVENYSKDAAAPSQLWLPSVPGEQTANQEAAATAEMSQPQQQDISPVSEQDADTAAVLNAEAVGGGTAGSATLQPAADEPTIAPLRTPSPRAPQMPTLATSGASDVPNETAQLHTKQSGGIAHSASKATRDPEYSPSDYEPKSLQREATFSTVTSSPLKESDILRDEIIKSLSPRNDTAPEAFPPPTSQKPVSEPSKEPSRESTYTLSGYDSYWAEGQERSHQPAIPEESEQVPAAQAVSEEESSGAAPVVPVSSLPVMDAGSPDEPTDTGARRRFSWEAEGGATAPVPAAGHEKMDESQPPVEQVPKTAPLPTGDAITEKANDQGPGQEPASDNVDVSHQVSQASTNRPQEQAQAAALDPPSPVSNPGDRNPVPETSDRRPSLAEQKSGVRSEATPVAPSPPAGAHPALASPTGSQNAVSEQPLMTFREIMSLPGSQERISKYDEARTRFATIESGLSEWIANLKASHPDHANATAQFNGSLAPPGGEPARVPSPMGSQAPSQQPYYQQYLNASSPTSSGPGKRLGGLSVSGQSASSAFGHSSDKIGTKGKEFMQSAGKMGKGLFSKGKSKLRGTGDKNDTSPPISPVQGKVKADRRSSWALSLGNRSRAEGMGKHTSHDRLATAPTGHSPQPSTLAGGTSISARPPTGSGSLAGNQVSASTSGAIGADAQHNDEHLPPATPTDEQRLGHSHDVSLPLTLDKEEAESSWDPFNGTPYAKRKSGTQNDVLPREREEPDTRVSGDWVVVPREIAAEQSKPPQAVPEDSGVGMSSQPVEPRMVLRRDGSFGLPLISRSNTSDFGFQDALGLGDQTETPTDQQAEPRDGPSVAVGAAPEERRDAAALVQQAETQQDEPPLPSPKSEVPRRSDERARAQATLPHLQTESPVQNAPRPPGPWKLEESYLSEPLHQVSRKRSGTSDSQNVIYGLDKEMGITSSPTSSTPVMGPRQRGGNQLPPSSAQRYPELFTTAQAQSGPRGRSNSGSQIALAGFPRTQSNEFDIPGVGPPEDRGRRKSSGIFKEFGNRLARASSRDRRPSTSDNRAPTSDNVRSDVASETSVWTENNPERRSKRSSLLSGLRRRPSMDMAASVDDLRPPQAPMANQSQAFGPSASQNALPLPSEEERKFKSGLGGFSTDRFKLRSSRTERWDSPNGPNGSPAPVDQPQSDHGAGKSRLSGLGGKVVGLAGAFRRPQSEQSQAAAAQDHNEEARQVSQQHLPSSMAPPPPAAGQQQERRRRPSASGLLSGFVGKVSSRTGEQQQQPTGQPQQQGLHTGMRPDDMPSDTQMHAGRASMDHRPSVSNSLSQQGPPQAGWGPDRGQYAQQASREPGIPPQSIDPRSSIGQSPSPEISRKDALADGERFDTVSPELSVRSGPQNPPAGQHDEDARNLQQFNENRLSHHPGAVHMNQQRQGVFNQQGSYSSGRLPPGQNAQQLQPQQQQPANGQASLGPQNAQSSGFFRPQSSQPDALNVPGSRHSSMSLSQSSTQGRPQGEGSRWRGLKNRIGAQLATSNQTQERPGEKDERSGKTKLFGAFKRGSKQPSGPPVSMYQQAGRGQQWGPQDAPHPGPQGQSPGQPPHAMGYDPRNIQQGMIQPGQQHLNQSGGQPQRPTGGPNPQDSYQYQRQPSMGGSTGQQPQVFSQNHVQAAGHPAQQPQQQMQREKEYEQVPIPGPYGIVTGQGNAHNMDRQMRNYATSFQYNNAGQSPHPGQGQHAQQHQRLQSQGAVSPPPDTQNANVGAMSQAPPGFETRRPSDAYGTANPVTRAAGNMAQVGRTSPQQGQQSFLPSSASPPPQSALPPPPSAAARPSYPREDSEVLPSGRQAFVKRKPTVPNGRAPTAPHETPAAATQRINDEGPKNNTNLSVDVAKAEADKEEDIYDATPRVVQQDKMGPQTAEPSGAARSSTPTAPSPAPAPAAASTIKPVAPSPEVKKVEPDTGKSFAMELEDTEEARKRTIRLDSQEEKIYYDPADDDDNPTMSATSYPGQEWNPYGEFEYSDIGDDAQNEGIRGR